MSHADRSPAAELLADPKTYALLLAASMVVLAVATISPALAGLEALFAEDPNAAMLTRLLVPAPSLAVAVLSPFAGAAADRFGRVRLLLAGVALFAISGTAGFYLPDLQLILASRLLLGVSVAMIMTSYTALIGDCFFGEHRSLVMGWQVSARNIGGFVFISIGGVLAGMSPQLPFLVYGLGFLFIPFILIAFRGHDAKVQSGGSAKGESEPGEHKKWLLPVLAIGFFVLLTVVMFFQMPTQLPFFTASLGFDSASATAITLGALTLCGGIGALLTAWLKRIFGVSGLFAIGYGFMAAGFGILVCSSGLIFLTIGTSFIGIGFALLMPAFTSLLLDYAPANRRGTASGVLATGASLGQFVSPFVSMPVITAYGFSGAFLVSMTILLFLAVLSLLNGSLLKRAPEPA